MKVVTGVERKAALLDCGAKLAAKHGAINVTRRMVATACKVSEGLVTAYMGTTADAQKLYARQAKKLGLTLPTKDEAEAKGAKLRAHGPRKAPVKRTSRKRSVKEVQAIKRNTAAPKASAAVVKATPKVAAKKSSTRAFSAATKSAKVTRVRGKAGAARRKNAISSDAVPASSPVRATAARSPKAPPPLPMPPLPVVDALPLPLPPLPLQ